MTIETAPPPLSFGADPATGTGETGGAASDPHARARMGDNILPMTARDLLRSGYLRIRRLDREIEAAQRGKADVYAMLKEAGLDAQVVKKAINRARLSAEDRGRIEERETVTALYVDAILDLVEAETAEADAAGQTEGA